MAEILPFRALHYHPHNIAKLDDVVTQPYDKISAEMQARYHRMSPYNAAHIIRGLEKPGDSPQDNVYTRAAGYFQDWIQKQILTAEPEPAIYPYYQDYSVPGEPDNRKQRRGFIALLKLEDYNAGVVHRHEETLSGPKADRLELLKATRAHLGQIFMLYSDPGGAIEAALDENTREQPWERVVDEYSTAHSVWKVTDPSVVNLAVEGMRPKELVIADGHHRYETALAYRNECRKQGRENSPAEYVMVTCVRQEADGLVVLPTHRVLHNLPVYRWGKFVGDAQEFFDWQEMQLDEPTQEAGTRLMQELQHAGRQGPAIGVFAGSATQGILTLRRDFRISELLPEIPSSLARLDVVILHRILLERVLGIDPQAVREEKNLHYVREIKPALTMVEEGKAQLCFLMNPTPIAAVWENALAGRVLPQKSTDFYPKLLSGLTVYWLDNPGSK
ncbi:MAG TPA: DUF1015 domain-containing protein [Terriglobia bacterium]|nr:DUF1015 domain-containing protein [Terriglobia bacterium]